MFDENERDAAVAFVRFHFYSIFSLFMCIEYKLVCILFHAVNVRTNVHHHLHHPYHHVSRTRM